MLTAVQASDSRPSPSSTRFILRTLADFRRALADPKVSIRCIHGAPVERRLAAAQALGLAGDIARETANRSKVYGPRAVGKLQTSSVCFVMGGGEVRYQLTLAGEC